MAETGWTKEYPSLVYGSWFWLRHTPDATPELHQLTGGRNWMESFGVVRDTTEFLGPLSPSDAEQLNELRKTLLTLRHHLQNQPDVVALIDHALNPSHSEKETR